MWVSPVAGEVLPSATHRLGPQASSEETKEDKVKSPRPCTPSLGSTLSSHSYCGGVPGKLQALSTAGASSLQTRPPGSTWLPTTLLLPRPAKPRLLTGKRLPLWM